MLYRRQKYLDTILGGMDKRVDNDMGIEQTAYINTLIERYVP